MKKIKYLALLFTALSVLISSCSNGNDSDNNEPTIDESLAPVAEGYIRINYLGNTAKDLWIWGDFDSREISKCSNWTSQAVPFNEKSNGNFKYVDIKLAEKSTQINFIVRSEPSDNGKITDSLSFLFPSKYSEIFVKGKNSIYIDKEFTKKASGLISASITNDNIIEFALSGTAKPSKETIKIESNGRIITPLAVGSDKAIINESLKELGFATVSYTDENGTDIRTAIPKDNLLDSWYADGIASDVSVLGYKDGIFKTWAPLSSKVQVLIFSTAEDAKNGKTALEPIDMTRNTDGTWTSENIATKVGANKYYKYRFVNNGETNDVCDIWAKVASKDSIATQIISIDDDSAKPSNWETNYTNPFKSAAYNDAIIYEMHITDWSQAFRSSIENDKPGSFKEIAEALGTDGSGKFAEHLKDLGITHVQILPMFEYDVVKKFISEGQQEEIATDTGYNWGYNPYNWNTPESRYANLTNSSDGTVAVKEMRNMIKAFHDAGIAVIMDVVYNHTAGTGKGSIYDMTIPQYFYRMNGSSYSDGSGCGNETATNHKMVKAYIIDSLKHWMNDYHINGFRFDLMGLHEEETMKEIYDELYKIDPNVMVYGEPWTGDGSKKDGRAICAGLGTNGRLGYGAFDDDFRDAIKGAEYNGFKQGHVQGTFSDDGIIKGLTGLSGTNKRNETGIPGLALHYVECHDNYSLFDKLVYSTITPLSGDFAGKFADAYNAVMNNAEKLNAIKAQNKLAAAYVLLSQGTPFINGGQEFLRTKLGDPDSYAADKKGGVFWENIDKVNAITLGFKTTYSDVYNTYKGLIALRKANSDAFGSNKDATAERVSEGVTKYTTGDFLVFFNATEKDAVLEPKEIAGYSKVVDITSGAPKESGGIVSSVPAKSFVILKK